MTVWDRAGVTPIMLSQDTSTVMRRNAGVALPAGPSHSPAVEFWDTHSVSRRTVYGREPTVAVLSVTAVSVKAGGCKEVKPAEVTEAARTVSISPAARLAATVRLRFCLVRPSAPVRPEATPERVIVITEIATTSSTMDMPSASAARRRSRARAPRPHGPCLALIPG